MDEIDAALDFGNVNKIVNYIEKEEKQFLFISHNQDLTSRSENVLAITTGVSFIFHYKFILNLTSKKFIFLF